MTQFLRVTTLDGEVHHVSVDSVPLVQPVAVMSRDGESISRYDTGLYRPWTLGGPAEHTQTIRGSAAEIAAQCDRYLLLSGQHGPVAVDRTLVVGVRPSYGGRYGEPLPTRVCFMSLDEYYFVLVGESVEEVMDMIAGAR